MVMTMRLSMKISSVVVLGLFLMTGSVFAAGFGVAGQQADNTGTTTVKNKVDALLKDAKTDSKPVIEKKVTPEPGSVESDPNNVGNTAFRNVVGNMLPLTPEQIRTLRYMLDQSQRAASAYPGTPPKPTSSSVAVSLSPGATPPVVRLRAGFVTSVVFLDSTGQPWPIKAYDIGDPKSFNVQWDQKGNTLLVQALSSYKPGNLAVILKDQDTPVMVSLMPGQRAVDYRVDLRMPGLGPNAQAEFSSLPSTASPQLLQFLNGVPPMQAKRIDVNGGPADAWSLNEHIYLRTTLTVVSPSWLASMSSPDGTHVYELVKTPIVLASYRGKMVKLMLQNGKD